MTTSTLQISILNMFSFPGINAASQLKLKLNFPARGQSSSHETKKVQIIRSCGIVRIINHVIIVVVVVVVSLVVSIICPSS